MTWTPERHLALKQKARAAAAKRKKPKTEDHIMNLPAELSVRNYRRIRTADLPLGPGVTLVCGRNMQGKTSLAEAARSALTMDPLSALGDVEEKRTKSRAKELVHAGADIGSAIIRGPSGLSQVSWPKCETKTNGHGGPKASAIAAGLRDASLVGIGKVERFVSLREALGANPTYNDLWAWLTKKDGDQSPPPVAEELARMIWDTIAKSDWTTALDHAKKKGAQLHNSYEEVTGGRWGSVKAETWRPEGWDLAWENLPIEHFVAKQKQAEAAYHGAIGSGAIDKAKRSELEALAGGLDAAKASLAEIDATIEATTAELKAHEEKCAKFVNPDVKETAKCPCCGEEVAVVRASGHGGDGNGFVLQKVTSKLSDKEIKALRAQKAELDGNGANIRDRLNHAVYRLKPDAEKAVRDAEAAAAQLGQIGATSGSDEEMAKAKADLDSASGALSMVEAIDKARALHLRILQNKHIQDALGDGGVRAYVLREKIRDFDDTLAKYSEVAGLGIVKISEEDATITCGGRPYRDLSGAEGLRLRTVLQVAMAKYDGSDMVVVDVKDFTDRKHILGLVKMLNAADMPALVVCHMNLPNDAPDLSSPPAVERGYVGRTFWLEDGVVMPLVTSEAA